MTDNTQVCRHEGTNWNGEGDCITCARDKVLGDNTQAELRGLVNEILRRHDHPMDAQPIDVQPLLDWHNKQTLELLDRLLEHGEDFTTFGDAGRSVAVEYIEAERNRLNKLKESS